MERQFQKRGEVRHPPPLNRPALTVPEARQRKEHLGKQNIFANFNYPATRFTHKRGRNNPAALRKRRNLESGGGRDGTGHDDTQHKFTHLTSKAGQRAAFSSASFLGEEESPRPGRPAAQPALGAASFTRSI